MLFRSAFHLIQSFKPGEVDAETAHRLGQQFADEVLKGKYEYVISTHVDKNHIHNHIIFNAASFVDHHGKHLSFRAPEQKNFTYMKSLGSYYSEENVRIRLAKNRSKVKALKYLSREARLYINISTYVTTGNREGFERWAKLNNLKEAARTCLLYTSRCV